MQEVRKYVSLVVPDAVIYRIAARRMLARAYGGAKEASHDINVLGGAPHTREIALRRIHAMADAVRPESAEWLEISRTAATEVMRETDTIPAAARHVHSAIETEVARASYTKISDAPVWTLASTFDEGHMRALRVATSTRAFNTEALDLYCAARNGARDALAALAASTRTPV